MTLRDEFRFRQILFKLTAVCTRIGGAAAAAAFRTAKAAAVRSWASHTALEPSEDFLLGWYNLGAWRCAAAAAARCRAWGEILGWLYSLYGALAQWGPTGQDRLC